MKRRLPTSPPDSGIRLLWLGLLVAIMATLNSLAR